MPTERKCSVCEFCSVEHNDYCKCEAMYLVRHDRQKKAYIMDDICIADMFIYSPIKYSRTIFKEIDTSKNWSDLRREIVLRMYRNGNPSIKNIPAEMAAKARWNKKVPDIYGYLETINKANEVIKK